MTGEPTVQTPFTLIVDSREQKPYTFMGIRTNKAEGSKLIDVRIKRAALTVGDYALDGPPIIVIERKSAADLFSSVSQRRQNFEDRLRAMTDYHFSAVVVEAEMFDLIRFPPEHTKFNPKSLMRTIQSWSLRFPMTHWWFLPGRSAAEAWTFRLLEWSHKFYMRGEHIGNEPGGRDGTDSRAELQEQIEAIRVESAPETPRVDTTPTLIQGI